MNDEQLFKDIEIKVRADVESIEEFPISVSSIEPDSRDYVDRMFYDCVPGHPIQQKKILIGDCDGNKMPNVPQDVLCVLLNYKSRKQGRSDHLPNSHLLALPNGKTHFLIPIHQVKKYALHLLRVVDAIEDEFAEQEIELNSQGILNE